MPKNLGTTRSPSIRVYAAVGISTVASTVSACDSGTHAKPVPTVTITTAPAPTASQIAAKAREAFAVVSNVRVRGKVITDEGRISIDYSVRGKNSKGKFGGPLTSKKNTETEFIKIGNKYYIKGSEVSWKGPKPPAEILDRLKNQWTLIRGDNIGTMGSLMAPTMMFGSVGASENVSFGPGHDFEGTPAFDITDGKGTHLWVSAQNKSVALAMTNDKSSGDRLDFGYGQAGQITAPAHAVDFSKQGTLQFP